MFKEYPKCVYLGGNVESAYRVVFDADAEAQARTAGYLNANESQEKAKRKYERKEKAE